MNKSNLNHKNDIHIVFCIDKNYVQHCAVTVTSIFSNTIASNISISIIYSNINDKSKSKLESYIKKYTSNVKFILINESKLKRFPVSDHITLASYYRIFLADLLDTEIKKVLYLDCDLIVKKDILNLWNVDISDYSHAAALENGLDIIHKNALGILNNDNYFNAGVMLINLEYWRNNDISKKSFEFIQNEFNKIKFWDQDVLNFVLQSQWFVIDQTWNANEILFKPHLWKTRKFNQIKCQAFEKARLDPAIVHFTGTHKPWHSYSDHPLKHEYYQYLEKTPWNDFVPIKKPSFFIKVVVKLIKFSLFIKKKLIDRLLALKHH